MRITERATPVAAVLSALASIACCLPLGVAGAVGSLGLSFVLVELQPALILLALIFLGVSLGQLYLGQRSCRQRSSFSVILFGVSAALVLAIIIFPQSVAALLAILP